jgi:DNA polymerase
MHCHDEVVCEVPVGFGSLKEVENILCEIPKWAQDLPMAVTGWRGVRYKK